MRCSSLAVSRHWLTLLVSDPAPKIITALMSCYLEKKPRLLEAIAEKRWTDVGPISAILGGNNALSRAGTMTGEDRSTWTDGLPIMTQELPSCTCRGDLNVMLGVPSMRSS